MAVGAKGHKVELQVSDLDRHHYGTHPLVLLREFGCDLAQGWLVGRPEPAAAFIARRVAERRVSP